MAIIMPILDTPELMSLIKLVGKDTIPPDFLSGKLDTTNSR
jgi:hypothetical protein